MRKPSQSKIAAALAEYDQWALAVGPRIEALDNRNARIYFRRCMAEIRERVSEGDLGICTYAMSAHVTNTVKWCTADCTGNASLMVQ